MWRPSPLSKQTNLLTMDDGQTDRYVESHTSASEVELTNRLMVGGRRTLRLVQQCLFAAAGFRRDSVFSLLAQNKLYSSPVLISSSDALMQVTAPCENPLSERPDG